MQMSIIQRVRKVCKWLIFSDYADNDAELAKLLGYTKSSFSQILNEKVPLSEKFIDKLCLVDSNINKVWILSNSEEMLKYKAGSNNSHVELWEKERDILNIQIETLKDKDQLQSKVIELYNNINEELKLRIENLENEISELKQSTSEPILYRSVAEPAPELSKIEPK
jgi:transcriptional regulator with XRE-family HTH domain